MKAVDKRWLMAGGAALAAATAAAVAINQINKPYYLPLQVVSKVDLQKYAGEWFEIARLPVRFEKNCYKSKAHYSVNSDGTLEVVNSCHQGSPDGKLKKTTGKAFVKDPDTNAKLKVQFQWPFRGDYKIIALGDEYEYAMVGTEDRKNLWILSRTPELNIGLMRDLLDIATEQGFEVADIIFTLQEG